MAAIVYLATNRTNGKRYVGITGRGLEHRRAQHERDARRGADSSPLFHMAIRKHGDQNFDWIVLIECSDFESALSEEMRLIGEIRPEYNMSAGGRGCSGTKRTPEQRERMGVARRGKPFSDEHRKNLSKALTGKKQSEITISKRLASRMGKPLSVEHREKIRAALTGRKRPPEVVAKMVTSLTLKYAVKPWVDEGICRRTWKKRQRLALEAAA